MTYSDMVTLLLVFFVVLYMLTPGVDLDTLQDFLQRFQGGKGVMKQQESVMNQSSIQIEDNRRLREQRLERWQALLDYIEERQLEDHFEIDLIPEGIRITLSESVTFNSGSSDLLPEARNILSEIAVLFSEDIYEIEVQGHTDNVPLRQSAYYRSNWDLGASRSISVVRFIKETSGLPPDHFKASSYGEYRPVDTNTTPEGRRANRRVEIYVRYDDQFIDLQESIPIYQRGLSEAE
ncbi:flagellar motor protein MotB [Balneolales bacterium ANBcel1]|nr:flagellar motor protein MotB [Balneolales bacterium ANBcel1]